MDGLQFKIYNSTSGEWEWKYAYTEFGVMMGDGFLDALQAALALKPFVQNQSRLIDGKRVVVNNPRKDSRSFNLTFDISGSSPSDFKTKKENFLAMLYQGKVTMGFASAQEWSNAHLPGTPPTSEKFHLIYLNQVSYAQNLARTSCKMTVKFEEPDPTSRS